MSAIENKQDPGSPEGNSKLFSLSDISSDKGQVSPTLIAVPDSIPRTLTNESVTSLGEESSASFQQAANCLQYKLEGQNLILNDQIHNQKVFRFISSQYCPISDNNNPNSDSQRNSGGCQIKKRKKQVCVQYKRHNGISSLLDQDKCHSPLGGTMPIGDDRRDPISKFSATIKSNLQLEELEDDANRHTLTSNNPITIIQDLKFEDGITPILKHETLEFESKSAEARRSMTSKNATNNLHFNISSSSKNFSPSEAKRKLQFDLNGNKTHHLNIKKDCIDMDFLTEENENLKNQNNILSRHSEEQRCLFESKNNEWIKDKEKLLHELNHFKTNAQLMEEENSALAKQIAEFVNIQKNSTDTNTSFSLLADFRKNEESQTCIIISKAVQTQTETTAWQEQISKMKAEIALQSESLKRYEKVNINQTCTIEKQQQLLNQYESERNSVLSQKKAIKQEFAKLEQECKVLQEENKLLKEEQNSGSKKPSDFEQLSLNLMKEAEVQKTLIADTNQRLEEGNKLIEEYKQEIRKLSARNRD